MAVYEIVNIEMDIYFVKSLVNFMIIIKLLFLIGSIDVKFILVIDC